MTISEMKDVLQDKKEILSNNLNNKVESFVEYANETRPLVRIVSGEERLKSKLLFELSADERINVSGQVLSDEINDDLGPIFADYIVIISSALRIAPICLKNYLESIRIHSKRCFVIIDNWAMIPKNGENIKKIKEEISKDFSMVDVFNTYMISETKAEGFISLEDASRQMVDRICRLYDETHRNQINSIYKSLLKEIEKEKASVAMKASKYQSQLEEMRNNLAGIEKANCIKFDNIRDVFNNYSVNLLEDLELISLEDCIKEDEDYSNYSSIRNYSNEKYVDCVKDIFMHRNALSLKEYQLKLEKFRENLLTEILSFYNKVEKIEICDERLLDQMNDQMKQMESVDDIISKVSSIVETGLNDMLKKITAISKRAFVEEADGNETIIEKLKKIAKQKIQEEIDDEEERIKREKIIRKQLGKSIENANLKVFEETDRFIGNMKKGILALSNEVVVVYYSRIEKTLLEMGSQIEKRYRSR